MESTSPLLAPAGIDYAYVCISCGNGRRALVDARPYSDAECWSMHEGVCDCCGQTTGLAHVRDFRRPWHQPLRQSK